MGLPAFLFKKLSFKTKSSKKIKKGIKPDLFHGNETRGSGEISVEESRQYFKKKCKKSIFYKKSSKKDKLPPETRGRKESNRSGTHQCEENPKKPRFG